MDTSFKIFVTSAAMAISTTVFAAGEPVGYVFQPDTPIRANEMNANFQELADRIAASNSASSSSGKLYLFNTSERIYSSTGRRGMTDACAAIDPASSFCSLERVQAAIAGKGLEFSSGFLGGWLDTTTYEACDSWTTSGGSSYGTAMGDGGAIHTTMGVEDATSYQIACSFTNYIVCCK